MLEGRIVVKATPYMCTKCLKCTAFNAPEQLNMQEGCKRTKTKAQNIYCEVPDVVRPLPPWSTLNNKYFPIVQDDA